MRTSTKTLSLLAGVALFSLSTLSAVETDPVGYKTVTIKGNSGLTMMGFEFLETPAYSGQFTSSGTNTITVSGADFDTLLEAGKSYFLDLVASQTPENVGLNSAIVSWNGATLTLADDLSSVAASNSDVIRIHELPTIGSIFGVGGDVIEGGTALQADLIFLPDPDTGVLSRYYYSNGGFAGVGWRKVGSSVDRANTPIYFSDGVLIFKKSAGDVDYIQSGSVKVVATQVVSEEGYSTYSAIYPSGTTLGNSGLYDAGSPSKSIKAGSVLTADLIYVDSDKDGSLETYYYSTGGFAGVGWRTIGSSIDKSDVPLDSGFSILNRGGSVSFTRNPSY